MHGASAAPVGAAPLEGAALRPREGRRAALMLHRRTMQRHWSELLPRPSPDASGRLFDVSKLVPRPLPGAHAAWRAEAALPRIRLAARMAPGEAGADRGTRRSRQARGSRNASARVLEAAARAVAPQLYEVTAAGAVPRAAVEVAERRAERATRVCSDRIQSPRNLLKVKLGKAARYAKSAGAMYRTCCE